VTENKTAAHNYNKQNGNILVLGENILMPHDHILHPLFPILKLNNNKQ